MADRHDPVAAPPVGRCPICRRPTDPAIRPFCSRRCADIDLHRWLTGSYAVPAERIDDQDGASESDQPNETP